MGGGHPHVLHDHRCPPVYLTSIYAATTKMRTVPFMVTMVIGFFLRCYALALATVWGIDLFI